MADSKLASGDSPPWNLFTAYAALMSLATISIYAGAYSTLLSARKIRRRALNDETSDSEDDEEDALERLSANEAYLFPVIGSAVLGGLYLVFKYLGKEWINFIFGIYFALVGVVSVWKTSVALLRTALGVERWSKYEQVRVKIHHGSSELLHISAATPAILLFIPAVVPSLLYSLVPKDIPKPVLLTNLLALSFSHTTLNMLRIDSFKTGVILLSGLFIYDIWWVFGTEVMVKVATNFDAPIKILWPKSFDLSTKASCAMLGLGDIVIPGVFVTFALRFDQHLSNTRGTTRFPKPYFTAALTSYVLGLITTMTVMHTFGAAQPALLYLSPACILSFFITALARGELTRAWAWTEEETTKKELQTEETSTRATSGAVTPEPQVINVTGADRPQPNGMRLRDI